MAASAQDEIGSGGEARSAHSTMRALLQFPHFVPATAVTAGANPVVGLLPQLQPLLQPLPSCFDAPAVLSLEVRRCQLHPEARSL